MIKNVGNEFVRFTECVGQMAYEFGEGVKKSRYYIQMFKGTPRKVFRFFNNREYEKKEGTIQAIKVSSSSEARNILTTYGNSSPDPLMETNIRSNKKNSYYNFAPDGTLDVTVNCHSIPDLDCLQARIKDSGSYLEPKISVNLNRNQQAQVDPTIILRRVASLHIPVMKPSIIIRTKNETQKNEGRKFIESFTYSPEALSKIIVDGNRTVTIDIGFVGNQIRFNCDGLYTRNYGLSSQFFATLRYMPPRDIQTRIEYAIDAHRRPVKLPENEKTLLSTNVDMLATIGLSDDDYQWAYL